MAKKKQPRKPNRKDQPEREKKTRLPWEHRPHLINPIPRLIRAMEAMDLSQSELARRTAFDTGEKNQAVYQTRISKWVNYEGCPDSSQLEVMCRAMKISVADVLELEPEEITPERLLLRRRIRHQIGLIGEVEAERRLAGLPMGGTVSHPVTEGRPLGLTNPPEGSNPGRPKGQHKAKPRSA